MATDPTNGGDPFDLHCGICRHVYFQDDWSRTPYCGLHGRPVDVRVRDVCTDFMESTARPDTTAGETDLEVVETESRSGTTGPFYAAYVDDTKHWWYCSNCETADVAAAPMDRLKCNQCGNLHRASEWDAAYLRPEHPARVEFM